MGFNTTLLILNDALHLIKDDPKFGQKVYDAVNQRFGRVGERPTDISVSGYCNAASIVESHHADGYRLILVGGNTAYVLGYAGHWSKDPKKIEDLKVLLNNVAEEYGLQVRRRPRKS